VSGERRRACALLGLASLGCVVAAVSAPAQGIHVQAGYGGSRTVPVGDYFADARGEGFDAGWQGIAFVALALPRRPYGLRVDAVVGTNSANDQLKADLTTAIGQPATEETSLFGANIDLTYAFSLGSHVRPYALAGVGVYHVTISVTTDSGTVDNRATEPAWNLGGGLSYPIRAVAPFLEARYVHVSAVSGFPSMTFVPITVGIRVRLGE
jgi:opacity protein-like surface antigen